MLLKQGHVKRRRGILSGKYQAVASIHEVVWDGANCTVIHLGDSKFELAKAMKLMAELPLVSSKKVISS